LICGAISDVLCIILESSGVCVIAGIMGQADEVLAAFLSNQLNKPEFCMPGFGASILYNPKDLKDFSGQAQNEDTNRRFGERKKPRACCYGPVVGD
jgi:hypothetical protein